MTATGATTPVFPGIGALSDNANDNLLEYISVDITGGVVNPCWFLNRGINTAARQGSAPFRLDITFVYTSQGQMITETHSIMVRDTTEVGPFDTTSVRIEGTFQLTNKPDSPSSTSATTRLEHGAPPAQEPVGDPVSGTFPI